MIAAMAQWEREETVDRTKTSIAFRAQLGSPLGGPAPFGYEWKDKKLVPHPTESPVRKSMYDLFLKHGRKKTVVRLLNEAGHRTRNGSLFTSKTLARLLQDPTAKGIQRSNYTTRNGQTKRCELKPESEWITHNIPAIISVEIWEQCNALIEQSFSKQKRPAKKPVNLFTGIAQCSCGGKMYVPSNSPKYVCVECKNKIPIEDLEAIFRDELKNYAFSPTDIAAYLKKSDAEIMEKERLVAVQQGELDKVSREINRVYKLYQDEKLDADAFGKFYQPLEARKKQLEKSLPQMQAEIDLSKVNNLSNEEIADGASNLVNHWPELTVNDKRAIVETIVKSIVVGKGEIELNLCYAPSCKDMAFGWRKGWDSNPR